MLLTFSFSRTIWYRNSSSSSWQPHSSTWWKSCVGCDAIVENIIKVTTAQINVAFISESLRKKNHQKIIRTATLKLKQQMSSNSYAGRANGLCYVPPKSMKLRKKPLFRAEKIGSAFWSPRFTPLNCKFCSGDISASWQYSVPVLRKSQGCCNSRGNLSLKRDFAQSSLCPRSLKNARNFDNVFFVLRWRLVEKSPAFLGLE